MRREVRELETVGRGLADAHARATREIRLRQGLDARCAELAADAERLRGELRAQEASRLSSDRASSENAEIANQVRTRGRVGESAPA